MKKMMMFIAVASMFLWIVAIGHVSARQRPGALIRAVISGNAGDVSQLLSSGADPNTEGPGGNSVLMLASFRGASEIVKMLLDKGADMNARNPMGNTALMIASRRGYPQVVKLLLDKGADPNITGPGGFTALQIAERWNHHNVAQILKPYVTRGHSQPMTGPPRASR